jgi:hypothetical protein
MQLLQPLTPSELQPFIDNPDRLTTQPVVFQIAIASYPETPRRLLEVLANNPDPQVAEAAQLHVNWAGEMSEGWQEAVDEMLRSRQLGQNDRLAVELLKIAPVPDYFLSEWVPAEQLIQGVRNPHLPWRHRLKLLERLVQEPTLEARLQVAELPETPLAMLEPLAGDLELPVRLAVKFNPSCPPSLIELVERQHAVATDWSTDAEQLAMLGQNRWAWVRLAVAQNPSTPAQTLMQLAADAQFKIQLAVAKNPGTPATVLAVIAEHPEKAVQVAVAEHPNATEEIWRLLPSQQSVIIEPPKNPSLPLLERYRLLLAEEEEQETAKAHKFMARRSDSPYALAQVLEKGDRNAKLTADRHPKTPIQVLEQLAKDADETVRLVASQNSNLPLSSLLELAQDPSMSVRLNLTYKKTAPVQLLERLAQDESEQVRAKVAEHPDTPVELLVKLASDPSPEVCQKLTYNPNTPVTVLEFLGVEKGIVNARNTNTPGNALAKAVEKALQQDVHVRDKALEKLLERVYGSQMPASVLEQLADYPTSWIRSWVAYHPNTPASTLEKMINDDPGPVLWGIARNPNTPPHLLERLVNRPNLSAKDYGKIYFSIAERNKIPASVMERLLNSSGLYVRQKIAIKSNLPSEIAERLIATESDEFVLIPLARNPSLTPELLTQFVQHPNPNVCEALANHPNLTLAHWEQLVANPAPRVRQAIASQPNAPVSVLETLAKDPDKDILVRVAANPNTPSRVLEQLSPDEDAAVRTKIASHANTPESVLINLAQDEKVEVRRAVAQNPNTPVTIREALRDLVLQPTIPPTSPTLRGLSRLYNPSTDDLVSVLSEYAQSDNAFVRFVTLLHPLTPGEVLQQGVRSQSWLERYAIADNPATSPELRQQLAQDSNRLVRAAARANS